MNKKVNLPRFVYTFQKIDMSTMYFQVFPYMRIPNTLTNKTNTLFALRKLKL